MDSKYVYLADDLTKRNIRPSQQRLKILEYFHTHRSHPTADEIYIALKKRMPSLSKGTIYNTLKAFMQKGLIREISVEDNEARYELNTKKHGHFKCNSCGTIYDFDIEIDGLEADGLGGFMIEDRNVYFKGVCPKCIVRKSSK